MKTTGITRVRLFIVFFTVGFFLSVYKATDQSPAEGFKNIQVLKDMPASQLQAAMSFMAASLGVECSHCHTPPAMEKDEKPAKQTARRMLVMMNDINKNFGDKILVNC